MNYKAQLHDFLSAAFLFGDPVTTADDQSLRESGVMDSTGLMELIAFVEENFGIRVADDDVVPENFDTVSGLVRYIQRGRGEACPE